MALAAAGLGKEVEGAAKSAASRVRQAAATTIDQQRDEVERTAHHAVENTKKLAADTLAQTQQRAFDSLTEMPLEQAGPILLVAIAEGGPGTRRAAAEQLAKRWPPAADFPVDAAVESREAAVAALRDLWAEQYGRLQRDAAAQVAEARELIELTAEQAQQAQQLMATLDNEKLSEIARQQATAALVELGPPLLSMLEEKLAEQVQLPPELYSDVLPAIKPAFASLVRLQSADVAARRAAAAELAELATKDVLPPLAVMRLSELIATEEDAAVWQSALAAAKTSAHEAGAQMARQAMESAAAEVRAEACRYFTEHGDAKYAPLLLAALQDPEPTVRLAAVRALGSVGSLANSRALEALLDTQDKLVQMEAALALARLRVAQGSAAVERLTMSTESETRLRAAQAMGEIADPLFVPTLVMMLGDEPPVQQVAMQSLTSIVGRNISAGDEAQPQNGEQRAARWRHWYAANQAKVTSAAAR